MHVRVGRYGPYLEDMNHLDDEGNPKRASLPDTLAPDELTVEVGHDLIENHSGGPRASWRRSVRCAVEVRNVVSAYVRTGDAFCVPAMLGECCRWR